MIDVIGFKMEIEKFLKKCEFLYHLTDPRNFEIIIKDGILLSTERILEQSNLSEEQRLTILRNRRPVHKTIDINGQTYYLRDQRPISVTNLSKCLTPGYDVGDFLQLLNNRVFFWPNLKRLYSHFNRYANENPIIIKVPTLEMLKINSHPEFCRLNSGATRSNSYLNGAPPERGEGTFVSAEQFNYHAGDVAEVTFYGTCRLPKKFFIGNSPSGSWREINL